MRAVIILNGEISDYGYIKSFILPGDFIICADGGLFHAEKMGLSADLAVGDFDSFDRECAAPKLVLSPRKDYTDAFFAVKEALKRGYDDILMLAALGGRLDHALSNLGLLKYIAGRGAAGRIIDEVSDVIFADAPTVLFGKKGQTVSLVPFPEAWGVTLSGFEYPLDDARITFEKARAVSNVMRGELAEIDIKKGGLFIIKSDTGRAR